MPETAEVEPISVESSSLVGSLVHEATEYLFGMGGRFRDAPKAVSIFRSAADLGSVEACLQLGSTFRNEEEETYDLTMSKDYLLRGVELGSVVCYAELATTFVRLDEKENAEKAWRYFLSNAANVAESDRGDYCLVCLTQIAQMGLDRELLALVAPFGEEVISYAVETEKRAATEISAEQWRVQRELVQYVLYGVPLPLEGRIKWFNLDEAYGFITGTDGQECFLHSSALLSESGLPQDGRPVQFTTYAGSHGPMAAYAIVR